jgi:hypothetical protein
MKWFLPLGLFSVVRMIMTWGLVKTVVIMACMLAVMIPIGYVLWRQRGGGPDPGY